MIADLLELDYRKRASASKALTVSFKSHFRARTRLSDRAVLQWKWISSSRDDLEALLRKKDTQR